MEKEAELAKREAELKAAESQAAESVDIDADESDDGN